jgi:peptidoglycan-associated lipoprotein
MKSFKIAHVVVLGLVTVLAVTGCKSKKPQGVTPLPGRTQVRVPDERGLPPGGTAIPGGGVQPGSIATSEGWEVKDMNQDRAALAAYTVHFDFDSSVVKSSERVNVEAVAAALRLDSSAKLLIEGHCDERGTEEYNRALGERRALALREELAKLNIDPNRIRTESFGKDQPVDRAQNEAAYAKNRRGVFVLLHPK